MAKNKKQETRKYNPLVLKVLITLGIIYGVYWSVIAVLYDNEPRWTEPVSNILLAIMIVCGALFGLLSVLSSDKNK